MSAHNFLKQFAEANWAINDPGNAGIIPRQTGHLNIVTAGAETRTLADPPKEGILLCINALTLVGACTITVASAFNDAGATTITLTAAGQWIVLMSRKFGSGFRWRVFDTSLASLSVLPPAKYVKNTTVGATTAAQGDLTGAAYVQAEYSAVGAANLTTRTATQMFADHPNAQIGDSYVLEITNTSGGTTTLVAGAGVTLTGTMTMATNTTRRFNVKFNSATTLTIQSTGVGTIS